MQVRNGIYMLYPKSPNLFFLSKNKLSQARLIYECVADASKLGALIFSI
jgi:hypothetical protein